MNDAVIAHPTMSTSDQHECKCLWCIKQVGTVTNGGQGSWKRVNEHVIRSIAASKLLFTSTHMHTYRNTQNSLYSVFLASFKGAMYEGAWQLKREGG